MTAEEVLQREFLDIRCRILDLAAMFDRLDRAPGSVREDARVTRLQEALEILSERRSDRAEQVQLTFSRPYDDAWQKTLNVSRG
jgi:hypothetical protein